MEKTYDVCGIPMTVTRSFNYEHKDGLRSTLDQAPHDGRSVQSTELRSEDGRYSVILASGGAPPSWGNSGPKALTFVDLTEVASTT